MSTRRIEQMPAGAGGWADLARRWAESDVPEGWRAELIKGAVTLSPPPDRRHHIVLDQIQRQLYAAIPPDWGIYQRLGLAVPACEGVFVPDLAVVPKRGVPHGESAYAPAAAARMTVEITSRASAHRDRTTKAAGYALAGVPLYVLVDGWAPRGLSVTLYGAPEGEAYRVLGTVGFAADLHLPEPFETTLETGAFAARAT
ncbi:Uma2 family endonuclease [Streptomyces buecherae]|uniref:Uma2 family endonuclease n=1 Tax=Streptomyces buecherae TaxID=2763006 RepID=UPI0037AE0380